MPAGRPRASSRATVEEAAGELFLEQGYAATSMSDIARRAGVGRATLFGYVGAKSDLLWLEVDDALDVLEERIDEGAAPLQALDAAIAGARVPLAIGQAEAMGVAGELAVSGWGPWQVLLGAVGDDAVEAGVLAAGAPFGAQHVVATWLPVPVRTGEPS